MKTKELIYYPVLDQARTQSQEIQKQINAQLATTLRITDNIIDANALLIGWGDGFMLDMIKRYYDFNKSNDENKIFVWWNCGTLGFLLNNIDTTKDLPTKLEELDIVEARAMKVDVLTNDYKNEIKYAINDIVIWWNILDYFNFDIKGQNVDKKFWGTGMIASTPIGSSAYWLANGGPLIPADSNLWWIMWLASKPFNYNIIKPESIKITPSGRTDIMTGIDGYGGKIENVKQITISPTHHNIKLWFLKDHAFEEKRLLIANNKLGGI